MFRTTREFIDALEHAGELRRVSAPVSAVLEIAAITDRVSKGTAPFPGSDSTERNDPRFADRGGPALLFERVEGSDIPVLINAFGSYRRMEMALGCADRVRGVNGSFLEGGFDAIGARIAGLVKPEPPRSLRDGLAKLRQLMPLARIAPRRVRRGGACQEVVFKGKNVDLRRLPLLRCWPLDGDLGSVGYPADVNAGIEGLSGDDDRFRGRYVTFAGVHTIHPDDESKDKPTSHNIGMYRVQMLGPRRMAMHWHMHHDGASHWRAWKKRGKPMPVAIVFGGESVLPYAATCPLPPGISELLMAGFLNHGGIPLCRALSVPLWVPARAEIVIEGHVSCEAGGIGWDPRDPDAGPLGPGAAFEGPFGDHTGFYSMPDRYPVLDVTAITHRRAPIFPATIVGMPPQEDYYMGKATERIMLPLLRTMIPDIEDYDLPMFGAFHNAAFIRIRKQYPLHARRVMSAVWGAGQMSWTKNVFVVDEDVDVHDTHAVLRAAALHCRPDRDIERVHGPLDILDHAAPRLGAGMKLGFDCTRKIAGEEVGGIAIDDGARALAPASEGTVRAYLDEVRAIEPVKDAALPDVLGHGWLLVSIEKTGPCQGKAVIEAVSHLRCAGLLGGAPAFVVVVGQNADVTNIDDVLFHWCANCDAERDGVLLRADEGVGRLAFDATPKAPGDGTEAQPVRAWPPIIRMSDEIKQRVADRWGEYGIV